MSLNPAEIRLSPAQQAYIARQAERTGRAWVVILDEIIPTGAVPVPDGESALAVARRLGLVGVCEGPPDLSTNPEHLRGFGE